VKKLFIATAIVAALTAIPALAGSASSIRANVPFDFHVSTVVLPAGEYEVVDGGGRETLTIRSLDGKHSATFITYAQDSKGTADSPSLSFQRVNGKRYLSGITRSTNARRLGGPNGESSVVIAVNRSAR
jgi:hypothetical protein